MNHIWLMFLLPRFEGDPEKTRYGRNLAIVKRIIEFHGSRI